MPCNRGLSSRLKGLWGAAQRLTTSTGGSNDHTTSPRKSKGELKSYSYTLHGWDEAPGLWDGLRRAMAAAEAALTLQAQGPTLTPGEGSTRCASPQLFLSLGLGAT